MPDRPTIRDVERLLEQAAESAASDRSGDDANDRDIVGPNPTEPLTDQQREHIASLCGSGVTAADIDPGTGATTEEITPEPGTAIGEDLTADQLDMLDALTGGRGDRE